MDAVSCFLSQNRLERKRKLPGFIVICNNNNINNAEPESNSETFGKKPRLDFEVEAQVEEDDLTIDLVPENSSGRGMEAENFVFSNVLLLLTIFQKLAFTDLKSCRLVNRLLHLEATKYLRKTYLTRQIKIKQKSKSKRTKPNLTPTLTPLNSNDIVIVTNSESDSEPLRVETHHPVDYFFGLVENPQSLPGGHPCNNFTLPSDLLVSQNLQKFLTFHGQNIKAIEFRIDHTPWNEARIINLLQICLLEQLPMLEILAFRDIFCGQLIGTEDINLFPSISNSESKTESGKQNKLKLMHRLKTLDLTCFANGNLSKNLLSGILKVAPNLTALLLDDFSNANLTILLELNVIHLLKHFSFEFTSDDDGICGFGDISLYQKIVNKNPNFDSLQFSYFEESEDSAEMKKIGYVLSQCLFATKNSLQCLEIEELCCVGKIPCLIFPAEFPKLNKLKINLGCMANEIPGYTSVPVFPIQVRQNFSQVFPNLRCVELFMSHVFFDVYISTKDVFGDDEDTAMPLCTVRKLVISVENVYGGLDGSCCKQRLEYNWVRYLCKKFPNVQTAILPTMWDFNMCHEYLWKMKYLEELKFGIELTEDLYDYRSLDAGLTGFEEKTCFQLYNHALDFEGLLHDEEKIKMLRVNPSLMDLKHLKQLTIVFENFGRLEPFPLFFFNSFSSDSENDEEDTNLKMIRDLGGSGDVDDEDFIIGRVAGKFAFQMTSGLKVNIKLVTKVSGDYGHALLGIKPFVQSFEVLNFYSESNDDDSIEH